MLSSNYAIAAVTNGQRDIALSNFCNRAFGVPAAFYNAGRWSSETPIPGWTGTGTGRVRIVQGIVVGDKTFTVLLPPNWPTVQAGYPIVAQSYYDINQNLFNFANGVHAPFGDSALIYQLVAESGLFGRAGVVGLIWNGGRSGSVGQQQFADILDYLNVNAGADKTRVFMLGRSKGGTEALYLASNGGAGYRVKYVAAIAPGTKFGTHLDAVSATIPGQIPTLATATGYNNSWHPGWLSQEGWTAKQKTSQTLWGTPFAVSSLDVDAQVSPIARLQGLKDAGTKVLLAIGSHDEFIPFGTQLDYVYAARGFDIPMETHVILRGGHLKDVDYLQLWHRDSGSFFVANRFRNAVLGEIGVPTGEPWNGNVHAWPDPDSLVYYEAGPNAHPVRLTALNASSPTPFTIEVPARVWLGMTIKVLLTGEPGTDVEITVAPWGLVYNLSLSGRTNNSLEGVPVPGWPSQISYTVKVRPPGSSTYFPVSVHAGCGTGALTTLVQTSSAPNITANEVWRENGGLNLRALNRCSTWSETNTGLIRLP